MCVHVRSSDKDMMTPHKKRTNKKANPMGIDGGDWLDGNRKADVNMTHNRRGFHQQQS